MPENPNGAPKPRTPPSALLTLEEVLDEQKDLASLCARKAAPSAELFAPNDWYGCGPILKEYAGWPVDRPLPAIVPHGPDMTNYVWDSEKNSALPCVFSHSEERRRLYSEMSDKHVLPTASPFLYLIEMLKSRPRPERKGTLFFLDHSTAQRLSRTGVRTAAEELALLEARFQPVTICVYWIDHQHGRHRDFQDGGFPIVSAGSMYDVRFLTRLYHLLSRHQYAMSCILGSHIMYSIAAGCPFLHLGAKWVADAAPRPAWFDAAMAREYDRLFTPRDPLPWAEQQRWANHHLGRAWFRTPDEAREQLEEAKKILWARTSRARKARRAAPARRVLVICTAPAALFVRMLYAFERRRPDAGSGEEMHCLVREKSFHGAEYLFEGMAVHTYRSERISRAAIDAGLLAELQRLRFDEIIVLLNNRQGAGYRPVLALARALSARRTLLFDGSLVLRKHSRLGWFWRRLRGCGYVARDWACRRKGAAASTSSS